MGALYLGPWGTDWRVSWEGEQLPPSQIFPCSQILRAFFSCPPETAAFSLTITILCSSFTDLLKCHCLPSRSPTCFDTNSPAPLLETSDVPSSRQHLPEPSPGLAAPHHPSPWVS